MTMALELELSFGVPLLLLLLLALISSCQAQPNALPGIAPQDPMAIPRLLGRPAFNYQPSLPRSLLNRARAVRGDERRFQRVVDKLIDGTPHVIQCCYGCVCVCACVCVCVYCECFRFFVRLWGWLGIGYSLSFAACPSNVQLTPPHTPPPQVLQ